MSTDHAMPRQNFAAGEAIFQEGGFGDVAYVVQIGQVEIAKTNAKGKRTVLGYIGNGGMFGEMALIDGRPRMAAATAVKPTTCLIIRRDVFEHKLEAADPFVKGLLRILVRNLRSVADEMNIDPAAPKPAAAKPVTPPTA
jgi:CRP/FNR family transcriptional regulator, cyclic AMP receptor protein